MRKEVMRIVRFGSMAGCAPRALLCGVLIVLIASTAWAGTWTHRTIGQYEYWYMNGSQTAKFRYNNDIGQWWHYSIFGTAKWYTISTTGLSERFIGDGGWYTLGNGFTYSYYDAYDDGYFKEGAADRFRYRYASGQWLHSGDTLSWQLLGSSGLSGTFVGSGYLCDLGNGFTYKYYAPYHDGYFKEGDNYRFRYGYTSGQWYHSGDTLSWRFLGSSGLSAAFVGSGYLCDLGNGFTYKYYAPYHDGYFKEGDNYRFRYGYTSGQWYHSGDTLSWRFLGSSGLSAAFLGSGYLCDLGNGFTYWYYARYHDGYFKEGDSYRFRYRYASGQWYHSGDTLSWQLLGNTGLSATFLGSGHLCDLGNGFTYWYYARYHDGYFGVGDSYRFRYRYASGQWYHSGDTLSWQLLGNTGLSATFLGSGAWYDLGTWCGGEWQFKYDGERGYFARWISDDWFSRFAYTYANGQWTHYGWADGEAVLGFDMSAAFIGSGASWYQIAAEPWYYLYSYGEDRGYWSRSDGDADKRFSYGYVDGQWRHYAGTWAGKDLGTPVSLTALAFMGSGGPHEVISTAWWYRYNYGLDQGEWYDGGGTSARLAYGYTAGQWNDYVTGRGWKSLGATGQPLGFIGADGLYHDLGDGFQYKYETGWGYFLFDAAHDFKQWYGAGAWQYKQDGAWYDWSTAVILKDINSSGDSEPSYFLSGAYLYFVAYDGTGYELYRWDGSSFQEMSGNENFDSLQYFTTVGTDLYFSGGFYISGTGWEYDVYRLSGTTFEDVSENSNFYRLGYFTTVGSDLYFRGGFYNSDTYRFEFDLYRLSSSGFEDVSRNLNFHYLNYFTTVDGSLYFSGGYRNSDSGRDEYNLYCYDGAAFTNMSQYWNFNRLSYFTTEGSGLYFSGGFLNSVTGLYLYDLYRLSGSTFERISTANFNGLEYFTTSEGNLYFSGSFYNSDSGFTEYDLYRLIGMTFEDISGNKNFYALSFVTAVGTDLYFQAYGGEGTTGWDLYQLSGSTFQDVSGNKNFSDLDYFTTVGTNLYFSAAFHNSETGYDEYDLYQLSGSAFRDISEGKKFFDLEYFTTVGTDLYFSGGYYNSAAGYNEYDLYQYNGATFQDVSGNKKFQSLDYLTTAGAGLYFSGGFLNSVTGYTEYDLYQWNGLAFQDISGDKNFDYLDYFAVVGTDLYFTVGSYNSTTRRDDYNLYRWNGTAFARMGEVNAQNTFASPVIFGGDPYFGATTIVYGNEPWRLWATHADFLLGRMP